MFNFAIADATKIVHEDDATHLYLTRKDATFLFEQLDGVLSSDKQAKLNQDLKGFQPLKDLRDADGDDWFALAFRESLKANLPRISSALAKMYENRIQPFVCCTELDCNAFGCLVINTTDAHSYRIAPGDES